MGEAKIGPPSRQNLSAEIAYMDAWGKMRVDEKGVATCHHDRLGYGSVKMTGPAYLPSLFAGDYLMYYPDLPVRYQVKLRNESGHALERIRVLVFERYLDDKGSWIHSMSVDEMPHWALGKLDAHQSVVITGESAIPEFAKRSGLIQTYIQVRGEVRDADEGMRERLLLDDTKVAGWCFPP